jgi:hypothetical protein
MATHAKTTVAAHAKCKMVSVDTIQQDNNDLYSAFVMDSA